MNYSFNKRWYWSECYTNGGGKSFYVGTRPHDSDIVREGRCPPEIMNHLIELHNDKVFPNKEKSK